MKPVRSQREIIRQATEEISDRGIVFFSGKRDGKTVSLYGLLEMHTTLAEYLHEFPKFDVKPGEKRLVFIEHVRFPRSHAITAESVMRQILQAMGEPWHRYRGSIYDARSRFSEIMLEAAKKRIVYVLPIDNAENLPPRAYLVLKELNEMRFEKRHVGLGVAIAGNLVASRAPMWFLDMAREILVTKVGAEEIADIIEELYPREKHMFSAQAIRELSRSATTGVLRKILREQIDDIRAGYTETADPKAISERTAKLNLVALAA
jgi:hypothetical protein